MPVLDLGPVAQYTSGAFQSKLSVPVALTYTALHNAAIEGEETDAHRLHLYLQPRFLYIGKPLITLRSTLMLTIQPARLLGENFSQPT